jgi:hypothetical protein
MDDLLTLVAALIRLIQQRRDAPTKAAQGLRSALAARIPAAAKAPSAAPASTAAASFPGPLAGAVPQPAQGNVAGPPARAGASASTVGPRSGSLDAGEAGLPGWAPAAYGATAGASRQAAEAGLVRGLFAGPQSLVAAFIAGEVLAKPVALRAPDTAHRGSAL